ncbi:hypothetical protein C2I18_06135 [Paenibacillus sp. PK3_47]|uniref:hypothetical protein n=1 Tax=Paenibacillus sp. PK3_47 TaxID=2072642 RepID=UPI00201D5E1E|nr:hypothetical protein [Paenibacillus sp. PK3_47]UQZ33171.1 hypothetical protein C2I18_06135 [Paenibacillus sp. PK3_47]
MAFLSTGPIENNPVAGVRPTQLVTVKIAARDTLGVVSVGIQGYLLGAARTLYVSEMVNIAPNEVLTRNYFANLDAFEFVFTAEEAEEIGISVWGKQASGQLVDAHRVVALEQGRGGDE